MYWILIMLALLLGSIGYYVLIVRQYRKKKGNCSYSQGNIYDNNIFVSKVLIWCTAILLAISLLVIGVHQSNLCKFVQQRTYNELTAHLEASYVNPITQEDALYIRMAITNFNAGTRIAKYYNDNPWGNWFVKKDRETFALLDYTKIKFKASVSVKE